MARKSKLPEYLDIQLYHKAYTPSYLLTAYKHLAKQANRRMRNIEKAGFANESYVYTRVKDYLKRYNSKRFSETKPENIMRDILELQAYLGSETSTVRGYKKARNKRLEALRRRGKSMEGVEYALRDENRFFSLLSSKAVQQFIQQFPSSDMAIEFIDRAMNQGEVNDAMIKGIIAEYNRGEVDTLNELYEGLGMRYIND